jgi:hypothetical protein
MTRSPIVLATLVMGLCRPVVAADEVPSQDLFQRRILPILSSDKPSSCAECHLGGVDLKDYIRSDAAATFAALRDAGMIDLQDPEQSKLLQFIARASEQPSPVSAAARAEEFAAFRDWIQAAVRDPAMRSARSEPGPCGPDVPDEVIRHGRKDRVLQSFVENVWSERQRCMHCHSPEFNSKRAHEFAESLSWIVPSNPAATLDKLLEFGQLDLDHPEASLILTKPTLQDEHRGGRKFSVGDRTYGQFLQFIEDYAATVRETYRRAEDLPVASEFLGRQSKMFLQITGVPRDMVGKLLRAEIFARGEDGWEDEPVALSEWPLHEKQREWQHPLTLLARRGSPLASRLDDPELRLPPGQYRIAVSLDRENRLLDDPRAGFRDADAVGSVDLQSDWPLGLKVMTIVSFQELSLRARP